MTDIAIKVENLSKLYRIGAQLKRNDTLRDRLTDIFTASFKPSNKKDFAIRSSPSADTIWALKDVSFEVKRGEVVGVIGRNGAGKTTLLKILSRITEPTEGQAEIRGRVSSLLEVGTGFHPELTGRENIILNGAILGMKKAEIERKFDEIVAFAEIERFIDTPVKRYSSGMYVRLAFAVAAHLEPEILLVDEVLAVGDVAFQKKCLGKMGEVSRAGRTVLFISHNMAAVSNLCGRGALLDSGRLRFLGNVWECVQTYLASSEPLLSSTNMQVQRLPDDRHFRLCSVSVFQEGCAGATFLSHLPIQITIEYEILEPVEGLRVGFDLYAQDGTQIFETFDDDDPRKELSVRQMGRYRSVALIPGNLLQPGRHTISIHSGIHMVRWIVKDQIALIFYVVQIDGVNARYATKYSRPGLIMPLLKWEVTPLFNG